MTSWSIAHRFSVWSGYGSRLLCLTERMDECQASCPGKNPIQLTMAWRLEGTGQRDGQTSGPAFHQFLSPVLHSWLPFLLIGLGFDQLNPSLIQSDPQCNSLLQTGSNS